MKTIVCNFAPLRFLPYRETGEFVNVGVVASCPQVDFFGYRLVSLRRTGRVTHFFPELDAKLFRTALKRMADELARVQARHRLLPTVDIVSPDLAAGRLLEFQELVRLREGLLHFGETGMMMAADPEAALGELFDRFVERQFARRKEYQEMIMRDRLADFLRQWKLAEQYEYNQKVGDADFQVLIPFIHRAGAVVERAIKPLDLAKEETSDIYHHGGAWVKNMERLNKRNSLPVTTIFAVRMPQGGNRRHAANEICDELSQIGVQPVPFTEVERLRALAEVSRAA